MYDNELYPIGDAARRTGLSVSAIRYYSDAGIIAPTRLTEAGHRLYDIRAVAQLELIRTLRDLGTGLDEIRRLLDGETTLHDLVTAHLELVERQERNLRARRAALRTLVKQKGTVAQAALMHKLVTMADEERERLIDDFWNEVSDGLDVTPDFVERLRQIRPHLPEDPSAAQLEAWIELGDLVQNAEFRDAVRSYLRDHYATGPGQFIAAPPAQDFIFGGTGVTIMEDILTAQRSGLAADSPRAQELAVRLVDTISTEFLGIPATAEFRTEMAANFQETDELIRQEPDPDPHFDLTHGRYVALVNTINGTTDEEVEVSFAWIAAALQASFPTEEEPAT